MKSTLRRLSVIFVAPLLAAACASPQAPASAPSPARVPETRTQRQMVGLLEKFDRWDYNGDGRLTLDELEPASKISGVPSNEILEFYDTNGDGGITLREAQAVYRGSIKRPR